MNDEKFDLDYIQAAIETIELTALFLVRLTSKNRINEFDILLDAIIKKSKHKVIDDRLTPKYWRGVYSSSQWIKGKWEEFQEFDPFFKVLREKRDYLLIYINSNAIAHPNVTFEKLFLSIPVLSEPDEPLPPIEKPKVLDELLKTSPKSYPRDPKKVTPLERMLSGEDTKDDDMSLSLRKVLKILRDED